MRVKRERDPETHKSSLCLQPSEPLKWVLTTLSGLLVLAVGGIFGLGYAAALWAADISKGQAEIRVEIDSINGNMETYRDIVDDRLDRYHDRIRDLERGS